MPTNGKEPFQSNFYPSLPFASLKSLICELFYLIPKGYIFVTMNVLLQRKVPPKHFRIQN